MRYAFSLLFLLPNLTQAQDSPRPVEFNRNIRPILSDACFNCHGPDKSKRKADLHFDTEEGARADLGGHFAIVPGKSNESMMLERVSSADPKKRMPPPSSGPALTKEQIELLRAWIEQGAKWQKHWSFIPPKRSALPQVKLKNWPKNPIDDYVLARLEKAGLKPSPEADPVTLIRRVSLDLTGLPPTPAQVDGFVRVYESAPPKSKDAVYGRLVDRLLKSPRYGERMAHRWLDAARYADTNGYQTDGDRVMWRWRDWVIEAFNDNMPFDRFTIEQLAGDMLPKPTLDQRIATGFNRNHRGNSEGGVIPEEYAVEYVVDRVDTTATVWLGLTAGCAKCHDHKYDPVSQREFYQLYAYFNNVPERGKAIKYGNSPPYIKTPTREQQVTLKLLDAQLSAAEGEWQKLQPALAEAQTAWERAAERANGNDWLYRRGLQAHFSLDVMPAANGNGSTSPMVTHGAVQMGPGKIGQGMLFDGLSYLDAGNVGAFSFFDKFTIGAWINPNGGKGGAIFSRMVDTDRADGYCVKLHDGKIQVELIKRWLDDAIRVETEAALAPNQWRHVMVSYDGSRVAAGVQVYLDGVLQKLKINLDDLNQSFSTKEPFRIGAGGASRFHGMIDDVRVYDRVLPPEDVALVTTTDTIADLVTVPSARRTPAQAHKLRTYFLEQHAPAQIQAAELKLRQARAELTKFDETIPTTMVMEEMPTPRATHILLRGEYDKLGPRVLPGIPEVFGAFPKNLPNNRLGFAQWLVRKDNSLTARVAVNRFWQMLFGAGIVRSVEDFGAQGEWPTHPELLDWLAVEFIESGWDVKALQARIVLSAAYRQSSMRAPELNERDPENRLLARGPRLRLQAEFIRDQALAASGLLDRRIGGRSVSPYQPAGLWEELASREDGANWTAQTYVQSHGEDLYRRTMYTFWKRTAPPPTLMTFDAPDRETCTVRRARTNTPLQALVLLNDPTYVEASRKLAERMMREAEGSPEARITFAFRWTTARAPTPAEAQVARRLFEESLAAYRKDPEAAKKLLGVGESKRDESLDAAELGAWTLVASLLLNLDVTVTKN